MTFSPNKTVKKLTALFAAALLLQGCTAALLGTGGAVAAKVGTDPRTVGTQVDDETLEFRVERAVNQDPQIDDEGRVNAVSYSGRVLLIGQVPSENAKDTAESLAKGVEGVSDVYNELRLEQTISIGQKTKDSWITTQIKSKLLLNDQVKTTDVKVITENSEVFLLGNLTQSQAAAAADVASRIDGVSKVIKVVKYLD